MNEDQLLISEQSHLYKEIHACRKCSHVLPSLVLRRVVETACQSSLILMAQAPSEGGVRKSGLHGLARMAGCADPEGLFGQISQDDRFQSGPGGARIASPIYDERPSLLDWKKGQERPIAFL